jgi:diguanylate cyclase (GGDEF)-like protein
MRAALPRESWRYGLLGLALAPGAPAGLLVLRGLRADLAGSGAWADWAVAEIAREPSLYLYLIVSTALVFAMFGFALGRRAEQLSALSESDPLTGLLNARALGARLVAECTRSARYRQPLALILADVDGLKALNDRLGHPAGDAALRAVASALRHCSRASDSASRWGGDEFALVAPNTGLEAATQLGERIRSLAAQAAALSGTAVTVSAGVAAWVGGPCAPERLKQSADDALYEAKRAGRDCLRARECR